MSYITGRQRSISLLLGMLLVLSMICLLPLKAEASATTGWLWPVESSRRISSNFGMRDMDGNGSFESFHSGIDISCGLGTPVRAAKSGNIYQTVNSFGNEEKDWSDTMRSFGNYVAIANDDGTYSIYAHLSNYGMASGHVEQGQTIAYSGNSGSSSAAHLHFQCRSNYPTSWSNASGLLNTMPTENTISALGINVVNKYVAASGYSTTRMEYFFSTLNTKITSYNATSTGTTLTWDKAAGASGYYIDWYALNPETGAYVQNPFGGITVSGSETSVTIGAINSKGYYAAKITSYDEKRSQESEMFYFTISDSMLGNTGISPDQTKNYNNHYYERYDVPMSWTEAKAYCESLGGHLVTITDASEQAMVASFIRERSNRSSDYAPMYYIGLTDANQSGNWKWVSGESFSYSNWDKDAPEPSRGAGEYYAAIMAIPYGANKAPGEWLDLPDKQTSGFYTYTNYGFICEYDNICEHVYKYIVGQDASRVSSGYFIGTCQECKNEVRVEIPQLNETDYTYRLSTPATCTSLGDAVYTLKDKTYGEYSRTVVIPMLQHNYDTVEIPGDCTTPSRIEKVCTVCGDTVSETVSDSWSDWSTTVPSGLSGSDIQSRTEYRFRTKETTTSQESSLTGWTQDGSTQVWDAYGAWSAWSKTAVTASESRQVETTPLYRYYYYLCSKCGDHNPLNSKCGCGGTTSSWHDIWSPISYSASASSVVSYATSKRQTTSLGDGQLWYFSSGNLNATAVGTVDSTSSAVVIEQGYRSRTRTSHTEYNYSRWGDWSSWSETSATETNTMQVETRTTYRYNTYAAASHSWDNGTVTQAATCTKDGVRTFHCTACSATQTEAIPAKGHTEVNDAAKAATCTASGLTAGKHCSVCNAVLTAQQTVPAKGHTEVIDAAKAATCTETGLTAGKHCSVCNAVLTAQQTIPAKGHTEVNDAAKAATCTESGLTAGKHCSVCNAVLTAQQTIPAKGHTEVNDAAKAATCTESGLTAGKHCSVCNTVLTAQQTIPAKGHTEVNDAAKAATCTESGLTAGKHCSVCNTVLTAQQTIPAKGHSFDAGTVTKAATCTADGIRTYTCTVCSAAKTETIAKTSHMYTNGACTICGATDPDFVPVAITSQPVSRTVQLGETTSFKVAATGTGLTYQWQYRSSSSGSWINCSSISGRNTSQITLAGSATNKNYQYRCVITDVQGNTVASDPATLTVIIPLAITTQPASVSVSEGTTASFKVVATGASSYQWQWKTSAGTTWANCSSATSGYNTATLKPVGTAARNGYQYRCVVKDASGNTVTSNTATLTVKVTLAITSQPVSQTVALGEATSFKVVAKGTGITYQWQYRSSSSGSWIDCGSVSGRNTSQITLAGSATNKNYQYRCVVTDALGNTVTSDPATLTVIIPLAITTQPASVSVSEGTTASFKVVATGASSYQWQWRASSTGTWANCSSATSGYNTATLKPVGTAARNGYQYRCVVKDASGNTVTSNTATLTVKVATALAITTQPTSVSVSEGSTAAFKVVASGASSYQWQWKTSAGTTWTNCSSATSGYNTATLKPVGTAARNGYQYRCVVKDASGNTVTSNTATLTVNVALAITTQPVSVSVIEGSTAYFKTVAVGTSIKYQWQWRAGSTGTWANCSSATVGYNTAELKPVGTAARNGYQYRCLVTDSTGKVLISNTATLTVKAGAPKITTQPDDQNIALNSTASFKIVASGMGLKYQWQWRAGSTGTWKDCSSATTGYNTATLKPVGTSARNGYQYRCVVTDANGNSVTSGIATLNVFSFS